jgi:Tfp pilus assembly protein PilN
MKPKVRGINLLPKEYIQAQNIKKYILIATALLLLESMVFIVAVVLPPLFHKEYEEKVLLELELMKGNPRFSEVNEVLKQLGVAKGDLESWTNQYHTLDQKDFIHTELLDSLTAGLPEGMTIDQLSVASGEKTINLTGKSSTVEEVLNYVVVLESIFKQAEIAFDVSEGEAEQEGTLKTQCNYTVTLTMPGEPEKEKAKEVTAEETTETEETSSGEETADESGGEAQ